MANSLEKDVELEQQARQRYAGQIERLKSYPELVTILESVLSDEEDHEEEFAEYLGKLSK